MSTTPQHLRERLAELEAELDEAEPDSLDWEFWNQILELVEQLPRSEQLAWRKACMPLLRRAVRMDHKLAGRELTGRRGDRA